MLCLTPTQESLCCVDCGLFGNLIPWKHSSFQITFLEGTNILPTMTTGVSMFMKHHF